MSDPSVTTGTVIYKVYLLKNGFWAWSASENDQVIILSLGHNSKRAAQHHLKKHRNQL